MAKVQGALDSLKRLGVKLGLDDFGTRYSSLGYLTKMPFSKLKIDRIFVDGIAESQSKRKLLAGMIALGQGFGMTIVAEGAETPEEVALLSGLGCEQVQATFLPSRRMRRRPLLSLTALTWKVVSRLYRLIRKALVTSIAAPNWRRPPQPDLLAFTANLLGKWQRAGLKSKFKSRRAVAIPRQRANSCQGAS